ncbi:MAG: hypothetical protein ACYCZ4_13765, partial [Sulfuricella sp.]
MAGLPKIDVTDIALFGNEASELEDEEVFFSYAVNRKELGNFLDEKSLIQVVSSYKGEGKSGLLRLVRRQLATEPDSPLVISAIGTDLSPPLNSDDSDEWTRAWKERMGLREVVWVISHVIQIGGSMQVRIFSRRYSSSRSPYARRWMTR